VSGPTRQPAEDLAHLKPTLDQIGVWERFLECYQEAGGPPLVTHDLEYFIVWQDAWRAVSSFRIRAGSSPARPSSSTPYPASS